MLPDEESRTTDFPASIGSPVLPTEEIVLEELTRPFLIKLECLEASIGLIDRAWGRSS